ncbi:2OG-Fe(II) oxygenase [bacterium]|nr:2OG-Fe(II) oxygenase [bacterium]
MIVVVVKNGIKESIVDSWNTAASNIQSARPVMVRSDGSINNNDIRKCETRPITFTNHRRFYQDILNNVFPFVDYYQKDFDVNVYRRLELTHLTYNKGDYIKDHVDASFVEDKLPSRRKISMIVMMSSKDEYQGGDLIVNNKVVDLDKGDIVMFEPTSVHSVSVVTEGVRKALLVWIDGPKWR